MTSVPQSPWTRLVAIIAAIALGLGTVAGTTFLLFGSGADEPPAPGEPSEPGAGSTPEPVILKGSIPLEFAVVREATEGPCEGAAGLQTITEPVRCLQTGPSLSVDRVKEATAFPIEGSGQTYVVAVSMLDNDVEALEKFTAEHLGKEIAIVADGDALLAPRLDQPIRRGLLTLTDPNLDRAAAVELARRFTGVRG